MRSADPRHGVLSGRAAEPLDRRRLRVGGLNIFYRASERPATPAAVEGVPLVLLHGLGVSSRYFLPLARLLAPHRAVYAPDLPGFGHSEKPRRPLDVERLAGAATVWLEALGIARAVLIGHSLGCQVAVDIARERPELVERLILMSPTTDGTKRTVLTETFRLLRDLPREPRALIALALRDYLRAGPWRMLRTLRYALADRPEDKLPYLAVPALVLRGERDALVTRAWAELVARLLPRARCQEVAGAAHAVQFSAPQPVAAAILSFLAE